MTTLLQRFDRRAASSAEALTRACNYAQLSVFPDRF